jgi:hypothetical protein
MRDFHDAKAMAHTLRAALAAKGFKITVSQSLELIAEAFGVADWNTLAAAIRWGAVAPRENASSRPLPTAERGPARFAPEGAPTPFSAGLVLTLHRALAHANQRQHEYTTLEHLLLALIEDTDASAVMKACKVDLAALKENLASYIDNELKRLVIDDDRDTNPTAAFQRVVQRARHHAQGLGRDATGADILVAIFAERESTAVWLLGEQEMSQQDAANFILHGIVKGSGDSAA